MIMSSVSSGVFNYVTLAINRFFGKEKIRTFKNGEYSDQATQKIVTYYSSLNWN